MDLSQHISKRFNQLQALMRFLNEDRATSHVGQALIHAFFKLNRLPIRCPTTVDSRWLQMLKSSVRLVHFGSLKSKPIPESL